MDKTQGLGKFLHTPGKGKDAVSMAETISRYSDPAGFKDVATVVGGQAAIDAGMQAAEAADDAEKEEDRRSKEFKEKRRQQIKDMFLSNGYTEEETEEMLRRNG
jgi:outer membrane receptor for Fe3+-dicitrate